MGMKLQYDLENIGNIDKASITIKPLTIIAGKNSSGKTFVTKSLYTILSHVKKNYFDEVLIKSFLMIEKSLDVKMKEKFEKDSLFIIDLIQEILYCYFDEQEEFLRRHEQYFLEFKDTILNYFRNENIPTELDKVLNSFIYITTHHKEASLIAIKEKLEIGFKKNFQITNLTNLIKDSNNKDITLTIKNICKTIIINNEIEVSLENNNIVKNINNVVFFDSPVYIKIRKALEKKSLPRLNYNARKDDDKYLKGYPEYIDTLYNDLDLEYIDKADFDEISQEIQKIISGKLTVTASGDINYTDSQNNTIPLSLTAMGISNIGLIDLLLRNNVINKGSFLIMDEPEVHLHPEWQVVLAQLLYKIAKSGANIILATHSLDFLKAFENILKEENEIAEDIIAINKMPYDETFSELSELEKVGIVLDDLSKPFYDLYMQDI
jgi:predicted ATPase